METYYRLEFLDGGGLGSRSVTSMAMFALGLDAPEKDFFNKHKVEFWFTKKGYLAVGRHCRKIAKRSGYFLRMRKTQVTGGPVVFQDYYQIAVEKGGSKCMTSNSNTPIYRVKWVTLT